MPHIGDASSIVARGPATIAAGAPQTPRNTVRAGVARVRAAGPQGVVSARSPPSAMPPPPDPTPVDNSLRREACPLCGAAVSSVGVMQLPPTIQFSTHWISLRRPPELWKCEKCGSAFTQYAIPEDVALGLYGRGDGGARWSSHAPFEATKTREAIEALRRLVRPGVRLLDVGCNTGELLDYARSLGAATTGVEPSDASRAAAAARGHRVERSLSEATGPFDVITAFDVLEHVYDVPAMLAEVASKLGPGGRFVALTGDITCAEAKRAGAGWWYVQCPEHVVFPTLAALGAQPGYTVEHAVTTFADVGHEPRLLRRAWLALSGRSRADVHDHILVVLKKE